MKPLLTPLAIPLWVNDRAVTLFANAVQINALKGSTKKINQIFTQLEDK
jgi:hypothetical protein